MKNSATDLLGVCIPAVQFNRSMDIAMGGQNLTKEQIRKLEENLRENPGDLNIRILLVARYSEFEPEEKENRLRHIRWLVENAPAHAITGSPFCQIHVSQDDYQQIKSLWNYQLKKHVRNAKVQLNAASYFFHQDKELAEKCLKAAIKISPNNEEYKSKLSHLYSLWDGHETEAFYELEKLCQGPDSEDLFYEMSDLPSRAFDAKDFEKAAKYANRLIELCEKYRENWNYGNAWNEAHTVLGRIAFNNGDIDAAKHHLHLSSVDIGTPQTRSFGPSLDLAKDLATAKETSAVLAYLDAHERLCGLDNNWAFEVRYKLDYGTEEPATSSIPAREHYDDCKMKHQLTALKSREPALRKEHLAELIESTKSSIERWQRRSRETNPELTEETIRYAERTLEAQKQHLKNLELLSQSSE
ncbi:MAG: hypothetical protein K2Y39_15675 [Candidatus Obscuribacterales bacterium]|nr:hypothetical protein [Candidatus Obscuribacterales bacterium]